MTLRDLEGENAGQTLALRAQVEAVDTRIVNRARLTGVAAEGDMHNTRALGNLIYTDYIYLFQAAGLVLLVAMIGAIVLTLRHKEGVKRQNISDQVARGPATAVEVRKVKPGQGI